ncbi:hypothetical protein POX_b02471 [Penicillium oxalicum]|uniref:Uncharacterized protein n=1 Tax=Penicillium oxalicum (strain 114-2 / CGMCC 5302) TaxID=933388 RepID=S8AW82_PENO1|nr:hypothetical protein POX_b02471 [Penicillium oxalicum]EPS30523.1 hypothetical protein PDE_05475 [Penicillium oxalicum 114-2]KAI2792433.1 hypothetical protein POX_b02471 [Penicillium oxalicum]
MDILATFEVDFIQYKSVPWSPVKSLSNTGEGLHQVHVCFLRHVSLLAGSSVPPTHVVVMNDPDGLGRPLAEPMW